MIFQASDYETGRLARKSSLEFQKKKSFLLLVNRVNSISRVYIFYQRFKKVHFYVEKVLKKAQFTAFEIEYYCAFKILNGVIKLE